VVVAWEGDGVMLAAEGDRVGADSDTVTEHADKRSRAANHNLIACANAMAFASLREAAILTRRG
jgi:hypothetical protein